MTVGWLIAVVAVAAVATSVWRRRRLNRTPGGQRRPLASRGGATVKRVEAYSFPVLGVLLVIGALVYWEPWVSMAGLAIGALFLVAGIASLRELRRSNLS